MKLTVLVAYTLLFITGASATDETTKLTLLHINDHHSHLTESSAGYINIPGGFIPSAVSENNGNTALIRAYYGGMPRLVTAFNALQEQAEANGRDVLKVHAGDAITGTPYFTLFKGNADAKIMSHICLDAFTPGNHEFDNGDAGLAKFLESMKDAAKTSPCNKMPAILGANIQPHNESPILADGIPEIEKSRVYTLTNGEKVGIVGIDIARKTMESSQPDEGTLILDEKDSAQAEINKLIASGVNKIVLLTHIGYQYDQDWMAQLDGVDVVIGGDSHTLLGNDITAFFGPARGPYATKITKDDGSIVCVVHAWEYSKAIGQLEVDFDDDGNVISCGGQTIFPLNPSKVTVYDASPPYDMSEEDATLVAAFLMGLSNQQARPYEEDEAAATDLALFTKDINGLAQTVVATSSELIPLETRQHESGTCDLVVQGFLLNPLSSADVAIQNQGGCRQSIEQVCTTITAIVLFSFFTKDP
jgi:5'-nucleotidase/UDP-sugar diphosphatase